MTLIQRFVKNCAKNEWKRELEESLRWNENWSPINEGWLETFPQHFMCRSGSHSLTQSVTHAHAYTYSNWVQMHNLLSKRAHAFWEEKTQVLGRTQMTHPDLPHLWENLLKRLQMESCNTSKWIATTPTTSWTADTSQHAPDRWPVPCSFTPLFFLFSH